MKFPISGIDLIQPSAEERPVLLALQAAQGLTILILSISSNKEPIIPGSCVPVFDHPHCETLFLPDS